MVRRERADNFWGIVAGAIALGQKLDRRGGRWQKGWHRFRVHKMQKRAAFLFAWTLVGSSRAYQSKVAVDVEVRKGQCSQLVCHSNRIDCETGVLF